MPPPLSRLPPGLRLVAVLAVVIAIALVVRARLGTKAEAVTVTREDLVQTVVSTGKVIARARIEVGAQITGTVAELPADEGDRVRRGQAIARLRDDEQRAAVVQARATLEEAEARLAQLARTSLPVADQARRAAEADLALARSALRRIRDLRAGGFYSEAALEEAQRNLDMAEARHRSSVAQADATRQRGSEDALARARVAQARAALAVAEAKLAYTRIEAPADGVVLNRRVEVGDLVQAGTKLFTLGAGALQLELQVDEKNLGLLAVGHKAKAVADAYPAQPFDAVVERIAPAVDAQRGTVEVKLAIPEPPALLKADMTVSAEIVAARRPAALTLAADALRDGSGTRPWVMAVKDGRAVRQPVQVGARGAGRVEILQGLAEGDSVVMPSAATIAEGARVRPDTDSTPAKPKAGVKEAGSLVR